MTTPITDIHTHIPCPGAIVSTDPHTGITDPACIYSMGIHPWHAADTPQPDFDQLLQLCADPRIVAIGECGLDRLCDAPLPLQADIFRRQIAISEQLQKPLIIHCVRAYDLLLAVHRATPPPPPWIIHGFRQKPALALQLLDRGIHLSLGPRFNPDTARLIPAPRLLLETDAQPPTIPVGTRQWCVRINRVKSTPPCLCIHHTPITAVAQAVAQARATTPQALLSQTAQTAARLFHL